MSEAQVVHETDQTFDMQHGPSGFRRVGFQIDGRVFWTGMVCWPGSREMEDQFVRDELLAETIVCAWNEYTEQE